MDYIVIFKDENPIYEDEVILYDCVIEDNKIFYRGWTMLGTPDRGVEFAFPINEKQDAYGGDRSRSSHSLDRVKMIWGIVDGKV